jgi:hypothetical protein
METKKVQYQYYKETGVKPVYAKLDKRESFNAYERLRRKVFEYNLSIPVSNFDGASLLEFGPSTGDNALIFAHWGANLSLVEPVESFIENIHEYFCKHELTGSLRGVHCTTFENYETPDKFDFVVAEGFVFHTGPSSYWLPRLASFGNEDSFIVISHLETTGYLIELLHAKCLQVFQGEQTRDSVQLAKDLYYKKWSKTSHSRSFDSWAYDNIIYPTLDAYLLNSIIDFQDIMNRCGMLLWSSWPSIVHYADISWIKEPIIDKEKIIARNRLNFLKLLPSMVIGESVEVNDRINDVGERLFVSLCEEVNSLAVPPGMLNSIQLRKIREHHKETEKLFSVSVQSYEATKLSHLWYQIDACLSYLSERSINEIMKLYNDEGPLADYWGSPNFYSVWHRFR